MSEMTLDNLKTSDMRMDNVKTTREPWWLMPTTTVRPQLGPRSKIQKVEYPLLGPDFKPFLLSQILLAIPRFKKQLEERGLVHEEPIPQGKTFFNGGLYPWEEGDDLVTPVKKDEDNEDEDNVELPENEADIYNVGTLDELPTPTGILAGRAAGEGRAEAAELAARSRVADSSPGSVVCLFAASSIGVCVVFFLLRMPGRVRQINQPVLG